MSKLLTQVFSLGRHLFLTIIYLNQYAKSGQYLSESSVYFGPCSTINYNQSLSVINWDLATQQVDKPNNTYAQFSNNKIMRFSDNSGAFGLLHYSTDKFYGMSDGLKADAKIIVGGTQYIQFFTNHNNAYSFDAMISANGKYINMCDQNVMDNIGHVINSGSIRKFI